MGRPPICTASDYDPAPYDLDRSMTVEELYSRWLRTYEKEVKGVHQIRRAWKYCSSVYKLPAVDIRARHIKYCMEEGVAQMADGPHRTNADTKNRIKSMFNLMLDYALEYELVDRNYARTFKLSRDTVRELNTVKKEHIPFTDEEMALLWGALDQVHGVDLILIQCYAGWRPQELGLIALKDVDLTAWTFTGGMKTMAGTGRTVPIHPKIRPLVERRYREAQRLESPYLLNWTRRPRASSIKLDYYVYRDIFNDVKLRLGLNPDHRPHDCRIHFVTAAKRAGVDEYAIKYIVGHAVSDLTERVYTKREFRWLETEMARIP